MFSLNLKTIDREWDNAGCVAKINLYAAWYMLTKLDPDYPLLDATFARIYFTEYGINVVGLTDENVMTMANEYRNAIRNWYRMCITQRLCEAIDRFSAICKDGNLEHHLTLPVECGKFFREILELANTSRITNMHTKETQCLDSLISTMIVNTTYQVNSRFLGSIHGTFPSESSLTADEFSSYTDIIRRAVCNLYRPSTGLEETHEDWGTKFRKVCNYVKSLAFIALRDKTFVGQRHLYREDYPPEKEAFLFGGPYLAVADTERLYDLATEEIMSNWENAPLARSIQDMVAPYGSLDIRHAICLLHNTNAELDMRKSHDVRTSAAFKFLCCQEYVYQLDEKAKQKKLEKIRDLAEG